MASVKAALAALPDGITAEAVELVEWRDYDLAIVEAAIQERGLTVAALALDTGGPLSTVPDIDALMTGVSETLETAERLGANLVTVTSGGSALGGSQASQMSMVLAKLQAAAPLLEDAGVIAALGLDRSPDALIATVEQARKVVEEVASLNIRLLLDLDPTQSSPAEIDDLLADPASVALIRIGNASMDSDALQALLQRIEGTGYQGFVTIGRAGATAF